MDQKPSSSLLAREIEASRTRIKQRRRGPIAPSREISTPSGRIDVRVDEAQAGVPAPVTRADLLKNFIDRLHATPQVEAKTSVPAPKMRQKAAIQAKAATGRVRRPDYSSPAGQTVARKQSAEIAAAVEALDNSRQRYSSQVAAKELLPEHEAAKFANALNSVATKEELVASISAAIATVLTDVKLETSVGVDTSRADVAFAEPEREVAPPAPAPAPVAPSISPAPLQQVDPSVFNVGAYIPVDVAAWDVEKFFWPAIVEQFLDVGEQAISRLSNFSLDILDRSAGRLAVAGVQPGKGATTIACSIARWSAKMKKRVLLVDANLNNPTMAKAIGLPQNISWVNVVRESLDASEAIIRCKSTGVCVMPMGQLGDRQVLPAMLLDRLGELLKSVEQSFDLIIIDTGAAKSIFAELSASGNLIDATMIVDSDVASASFHSTKETLLQFGVSKFIAAQNSI